MHPLSSVMSSGGEAQLQWPQPSNHNCFSEGGLSWMSPDLVVRINDESWWMICIIKNRKHLLNLLPTSGGEASNSCSNQAPDCEYRSLLKFLHKLALTSKRIQASQALRGRDDGQQEDVGRPVFDRNQWANGDFFCRVGPSCCGAHLCNKGW